MVAELQPLAALLAWLAVELLHLVRIGGRWRQICSTRPHCWPGQRSRRCTWSIWWPAAALLHLVELVAWLTVELLHLVRIGGRYG